MTTLRAPLVTGLLATVLLLSACGGEDPWPSAAGPVPAEPTSGESSPGSDPTGSASSTPDTDDAADPDGSDGSDGSGGGGSPAPDDGADGSDPAVQRCADGDLEAAPGTTTGEAGQRHTTVVWTNTADRPCTMSGFGGVDLRGPDDPTHGPSYSLPRSSEAASPVHLEPGGTAHTVITWLPGGDWTPTGIAITPPDETRSKTLPWPGAAVQRQDGATRPGTYIGPVTAGTG
ncbi:Protein of unknown function [Pseudonocardia ammonioxydans]|uniref:DUF4232 domain-containing protein n=1 Tax=Pseudonocardia ammonioxydans TaxID=260086 RepID=A0A1I5E4D6_PSUAM|nr:DUF4232 domain-containing protein [Pseudonocardia ammonioxydans]SFO06414.1 Protein of unknown function [Pseudonocardia ammonioxydans]